MCASGVGCCVCARGWGAVSILEGGVLCLCCGVLCLSVCVMLGEWSCCGGCMARNVFPSCVYGKCGATMLC